MEIIDFDESGGDALALVAAQIAELDDLRRFLKFPGEQVAGAVLHTGAFDAVDVCQTGCCH